MHKNRIDTRIKKIIMFTFVGILIFLRLFSEIASPDTNNIVLVVSTVLFTIYCLQIFKITQELLEEKSDKIKSINIKNASEIIWIVIAIVSVGYVIYIAFFE